MLDRSYHFINRRAIIDIDDVLLEFARKANQEMNKLGKIAAYDDYVTYNFSMYHEISAPDFKRIVDNQSIYLDLTPIEGAVEAINTLKDKGFIIDLVTARGGYKDAEKRTIDSLAKNGISYDSLTLIDSSKNKKSDYYKQHSGNLAFIADDAVHNIIDAAKSNTRIAPFCIAAPWNDNRNAYRHAELRVNSLSELSKIVNLI